MRGSSGSGFMSAFRDVRKGKDADGMCNQAFMTQLGH